MGRPKGSFNLPETPIGELRPASGPSRHGGWRGLRGTPPKLGPRRDFWAWKNRGHVLICRLEAELTALSVGYRRMAEDLGVPVLTMLSWIKGDTIPPLPAILLIMDYLGISDIRTLWSLEEAIPEEEWKAAERHGAQPLYEDLPPDELRDLMAEGPGQKEKARTDFP